MISVPLIVSSPREHVGRAGLFISRTPGAVWISVGTKAVSDPKRGQTGHADTAIHLQRYGAYTGIM